MPERILRIPDLCERFNVGRSTIYVMIKNGELPPPLRLSENCRGWREHTIDKLIREKEKRAAGR